MFPSSGVWILLPRFSGKWAVAEEEEEGGGKKKVGEKKNTMGESETAN